MISEPRLPVRWRVVVPVKGSGAAKSRLRPPAPLERPDLARVIAEDTLSAVCSALPPHHVTVVTSDGTTGATARRLGALVVPDPGTGLDDAVGAGLDVAARVAAADGITCHQDGFAVLLGDLPALTPADLTAALEEAAAYPRAVVPDTPGTGTVLLTSLAGPPVPRFGAGSAARHGADAERLDLPLPRLRRDVDTWADLQAAVTLGVGPATRAALARLE